ncbi:MAG: hypothetical protein QXJ02_06200, partial [Candidatus Bathyarchaeia archaeon]
MLEEGTILFGDFVPTLELGQYLRANYPLWSNRNSFNHVGCMRLPYLLIFCFPFYVFDAPAEFFFKFLILNILVTSGISMYLTAKYFLSALGGKPKTVFGCGLLSSLLYAFNPWVMDRIYHTFLLVTYSLFPLIFIMAVRIFLEKKASPKEVLTLVLLCTFGSTSPHGVFFIFFLIATLYVFALFSNRKDRIQNTKNFALTLMIYFFANAFWILPLVDYSFLAGSVNPDYIFNVEQLKLLSGNSDLTNVFRLVSYWWPKVPYSFDNYFLNALWVTSSITIPLLSFSAFFF